MSSAGHTRIARPAHPHLPAHPHRRGAAALKAGMHAIEVRYFQRDFVAGLDLKMDSPGEPLSSVPASRLSHAEGRGLSAVR